MAMRNEEPAGSAGTDHPAQPTVQPTLAPFRSPVARSRPAGPEHRPAEPAFINPSAATSLVTLPTGAVGLTTLPVPVPVPAPAAARPGVLRPWVRRRAWILVAALVAGAAGGHVAAARHAPSYTAEATLVVPAGAGAQGPGDANDAAALAITYATFIPEDGALLRSAARRLGVPSEAFTTGVAMSAETGTSVMVLKYAAATPGLAVQGARALALTIVETPPVGSGVPRGSVDVVRLPVTATSTASLEKYALPLGALFGLALGCICVLAAERADPRLDDDLALAEAAGCPATAVPGVIGLPEVARAIALQCHGETPIVLVPLTTAEVPAATALADALRGVWPRYMPPAEIEVGSHFEAAVPDLATGRGSTVLVVRSGTPRRRVTSAAGRLRLLGGSQIWAILSRRRPRWVRRAR
jgi:hypothetical protein